MSTREYVIEKRLVDLMTAKGGWALKYTSSIERGLPDRMCFFPSGKLVWVELKKDGKKPTKLQYKQIRRLKGYKQEVIVLDSIPRVNAFINYAIKEGWFNG